MTPLEQWRACAGLRQTDMEAMAAAGVPLMALAGEADGSGFALARARVVVHPAGRRFEFAQFSRETFDVAAYVVPAVNRHGELADLCAFSCSNQPFAAAWLGRVGMLGEDQVDTHVARPLRVFPDALSWLCASRDGVVIVDPVRAAPILRDGGPILVGSTAERRRLADMLRIKLPSIEIEAPARRAAAE